LSTAPSYALKKPVLLAIGDAVAPTGFARVMLHILSNLQHEFEIHQIGINYHGDPHDLPYKIYPAEVGGDLLGVGRMASMIQIHRPDVIFLLNDLWVLQDYMREIRKVNYAGPVIAYCPIDSGPVNGHALHALEGLSEFVVYTEFARDEVQRTLDVITANHSHFQFPEIRVIAHGVDTERFFPLFRLEDGRVDRHSAMRALYGDDPDFDNAFIVLNANRNQPRKRIDITMKGFAQFAIDKPPHVKLHMHMGIEDAGWHLTELARRYGIEDRLILSTDGNNLPDVPDAQLNLIYNSAAVGVNTSTAEGWGLVAFEHAAAGGAQIVPDHSACRELWQNHGLLIDVSEELITEGILTEAKIVSSLSVAQQLEQLYRNPALLDSMSATGIDYVRKAKFQWPLIAAEWAELILAHVRKQKEA
jgi:glycosyltransferase involved in cell wall biosynthesis